MVLAEPLDARWALHVLLRGLLVKGWGEMAGFQLQTHRG